MNMTGEQALAILRKHASTLDVPYPHWLGGDGVDQGPSYCRACADAKVAAGEAEYVDGGWQQDDDNCCHCEVCQELLEYNLTEYGASAELDHYTANPPTAPISPETAFHIMKMLEHDESNVEAVAIAVAAAQLIEQQPASHPTYQTKPGESVMGIALRQLKDESRWVEIRDLNAHAFPDIGPHDYFPVDTLLKLPVA